jgi:hypothetical protein
MLVRWIGSTDVVSIVDILGKQIDDHPLEFTYKEFRLWRFAL